MQRYPATSLGGGVSNNTVGGPSSRENARVDSAFPASNFSLNPRRPSPLIPYKLKCDKEPLNSRLGPPDFYPQVPNCPEETLTREYAQSGYKETVDGIEEAREIVLSQATYFTKAEIIFKCKEAIRKRLRLINESRALKRKAGQVYGVPLSGPLLVKPGVFPEQRPCNEDFRRKWVEALSLHHKRLRSLADSVPHGYRRRSLFEVLIRYNVPLLRATWFIRVTYLNQVRPASTNVSSGTPDKAQFTRTELWTRDVLEYLNQLFDDFFSRDGTSASASSRDQLLQTSLPIPAQQRTESGSSIHEVEEPSLQFRWRYMVRLLNWHYTEGLILPSLVIEWVFNQLQEKGSAEAFELLLPVICDFIESISLSQTYLRTFVDIAVRSINDLCPAGSSLLDYSKIPPIASTLIEMLHYLILAAPDAFIALDCIQLPSFAFPDIRYIKSLQNLAEREANDVIGTEEIHLRHMSFGYVISTIQKRASNLAKIANPSLQGHGAAKVLQLLDKALVVGDLRSAYSSLFEDLSDVAIEERWIAEVSPCLRSSLKWIGSVSLSLICSVFFLCEWATCSYRDCRTTLPQNLKFSGGKDFAQVYIVVLLLKLKKDDMLNQFERKTACNTSETSVYLHDIVFGQFGYGNANVGNNVNKPVDRKSKADPFQSPGPLHDIIVCWLDQHETGRGFGNFKRLQVLIMELIRNGIFYPQVYLRQLIVSGIMDRSETSFDLERRARHQRILKQLPGSCLVDVLEEGQIAESALLYEAARIYSNERRLVLQGFIGDNSSHSDIHMNFGLKKQVHLAVAKDALMEASGKSNMTMVSPKLSRIGRQVMELKRLISLLLHLPYGCPVPVDVKPDVSQGGIKRPYGSFGVKLEMVEGSPGCEECKKVKRQKLGDERSSAYQLVSSNQSDDEDTWWVKRGPKPEDPLKVDPPLKLAKNASRGRQKSVRKMSLAQLAAARIESSQGASTSHVCDNKVTCPHHRPGTVGELPRDANLRAVPVVDIGKSLKQLRLLEKRSISIWLIKSIKNLVEENEKFSKQNSSAGVFSVPSEDGSGGHWKLGEDELSAILYILDISCDLISAVRLILWLLPKLVSSPNSTIQVGRNIVVVPKNREVHTIQVGEVFLLSALQRYENIIVAADLLPEVLAALMNRTVSILASNGRTIASGSFAYARNLLRKYRDVASVVKWEKKFRPTCDQRLLAELDAGRGLDGDVGYSPGVSAGMNDFDEYFRQKMSGRVSRTGPIMKEVVQRHVEDAIHYLFRKERKNFAGATPKSSPEKWDDSHPVAEDIVQGLVDCIRQNGGATLEGDPSILASAVSAIVSSMGSAVIKLLDATSSNNYQNFSSSTSSRSGVGYILHIHITALCLLKDALGERFSRIFDLALAAEASSVVSGAYTPGKIHRGQFQPSPEGHDMNPNHLHENLSNSAKNYAGRSAKAAAAVSALVVGAIVHGVTSLERMILVFKLKEGLDVLQFIRSTRTNSNGIARGSFKLEYGIEVYVHWFRLLIGNCRTIFDGLVAEIVGEPYILALSRMQRLLPLSLVFPPVYSIFAMVIWRPYILTSSIATRDDVPLYHSLSLAIGDTIRHHPFRDLCLRNTHAFYDLLATDVGDSEFAAMLEMHNPDKHLKTMAFVPLRARMFLNAIIDCKMPLFTLVQEDGSWVSGPIETRENDAKLLDKVVHVFDTLQPAKFHWQWVELRLLLNEQALIEKIETKDMSFVEAVRSLSPNAENLAISESEKFLSEIVLTRILVRPDAASLYAEIAHLLGRSLEESLVMDIKWILAGGDVLSGRKSIRQQLVSVAQRKGLSTKTQFWKPWGWSSSTPDVLPNKVDRNKLEPMSIEEGEVVDEFINVKKPGKINPLSSNTDAFNHGQQYITEKALAELLLPCIDRSSTDLRNSFAAELIKQMSTIDQQINMLACGGNKQASAIASGFEVSSSKGSSRKGTRGGSSGMGRRSTGVVDSSPPSAAALKASMWLRLHFLVRLLPIVYADREPSSRNMRHTLASIILRFLGSRFIHEDTDLSRPTVGVSSQKRETEAIAEVSTSVSWDHSGDSLFDMLLSVLYGLLSSCKPSWLKPKSASKSTVKSPRDLSVFDRELAESLQTDLDRMELPTTVRRRLQTAMPILPTSLSLSLSCQPPVLSSAVIASLQPGIPTPSAPFQRHLPSQRHSTNLSAKSKALASTDADMEIDPWTLLEEGTVFTSSSNNGSNMGAVSGDHSNLKACCWLKGAVRVRRTDLTYVGALDDDS